MIHRAFANILEGSEPEVAVFFEATPGPGAALHLTQALSSVWQVPADSVDIYNVSSEVELMSDGWAFGARRTGDARLFETGAGGHAPVHYAHPESTLFLVRPSTLKRLVKAQDKAQEIAAGYLLDAECGRILKAAA